MGARARAVILVGLSAWAPGGLRPARTRGAAPLPAPGFHHLHLNSVNPEAAIEFYVKGFPSTSKGTFAGQPALRSPNNVWVLFNKVAAPPATQPQTAFWHFGWHVTDVRATLDRFLKQNITAAAALHRAKARGTVFVSSDTYPGSGGVLGLTRARHHRCESQGREAGRRRGVRVPARTGRCARRIPGQHAGRALQSRSHVPGPAVLRAALVSGALECAPSRTARRVRSCAPKANCAVERGPDKTLPALDWDGMSRTPSVQTTVFGDVSLFWYMNQGSTPAGPTRGHLMDHFAVSVGDLDAWIAKLKSENVTFLEQPYTIGGLRAVMIEGPSKEAIEIIEVRP